jgi:4-hydroxy-tetrahydrodipicolinate reductase
MAAANFSIGMTCFRMIVEEARARSPAWRRRRVVHELHHSAKKDAPSGTALMLKAAMERPGITRDRHVVHARRLDSGTHQIGFDAPAETVTLTHTSATAPSSHMARSKRRSGSRDAGGWDRTWKT